MKLLRRMICDKGGSTAIEYGLIAALISLSIIVGATATGTSLKGLYGDVSDKVAAASEGN